MRLSTALSLVGLAATSLLATANAASDVISLTQDSFAATVPSEKLILVEFYAPWCGHCQALAPEYEEAATALKEHNIPLAKVDCTTEIDLCREHGVQGYPTLKIFKEGADAVDYKGPREAEGIVSFLKKQARPAFTELTAETMADFAEMDRVVVIGVLAKDSNQRKVFEQVAGQFLEDVTFGLVEETEEFKAPAVVLYKKFDEGKNIFSEELTAESLEEFIKVNSMPLVDEIGPTNYARYFESRTPLAYFFYATPEQRDQYKDALSALAKELKGEVNFVFIDGARFGAHAENINLKESWPAFGIQNIFDGSKYPLDQTVDLTMERIDTFVKAFLKDELEPSFKSEDIPETNNGPVKVVVGHSYKELIEDETKDLLIEFYAPWCQHCQRLEPIYEKVGELYQGSDIVIAKMDATANDLPTHVPFVIEGFPTIKFRKAGSSVFVDYEGPRSATGFVSYLDEHASAKVEVTVPEGYDEEEEEEGFDEEDDLEHDENLGVVDPEENEGEEAKESNEIEHDEL